MGESLKPCHRQVRSSGLPYTCAPEDMGGGVTLLGRCGPPVKVLSTPISVLAKVVPVCKDLC